MNKSALAIFGMFLFGSGSLWADGSLSVKERVAAQEAIDRVYYEHRLWPKENPGPKPAFDDAIPYSAIQNKVEDGLLKTAALHQYWRLEVTQGQIQAEIDRIFRSSRDPRMLDEILAALGYDPLLVAECIARPLVTDRILRQRYASDPPDPGTAPAARSFDAWFAEQVRPRLTLPASPASADIGYILPALRYDLPASPDAWKEIWGLPDPRSHHTAVWTGTEMIVWGGGDDSYATYLNTGGRYDPMTDSWEPVSLVNAPSARKGHTAIWDGTQMIVWGGETGSYQYANDGGGYDPSSDTWTSVSGSHSLEARAGHTAVWTGNLMLIWGGRYFDDVGGAFVYLNTGGIYDPETDVWLSIDTGANLPIGRALHTAVWTGHFMLIWGGEGSPADTDGQYKKTGGRFDPSYDADGRWSAMESAAAEVPEGRHSHTAVWSGEHMIVWGGNGATGCLNSGGLYNPSTNDWTVIGGTLPEIRTKHTAIWAEDSMIIWGGEGRNILNQPVPLADGRRYNPVTNIWYPLPAPPALLTARLDHTAVWTGYEMVIWGGVAGTPSNAGARYAQSGATWTMIAEPNIPEPRQAHTAVWTGTEMLIWGGDEQQVCSEGLNTGFAYEPVFNTWTDLPAAALETRWGHSAVWTGTEMIVWGGYQNDNGAAFNDGARYDPATGLWTPISNAMANAPAARYGHSAVWTGSRMLIWGGRTSPEVENYLNTGALFRVEPLPAWTTLCSDPAAPCNAPTARANHTAVYTGIPEYEIVVWGGHGCIDAGCSSYDDLSSGGILAITGDNRYNWIPTPAFDAPTARLDHSAVWSGQEMIVWGGQSSVDGFLNTGASLYGIGGSAGWSALTTTGAPSPRSRHSAIWTGTEMLIWGGWGYATAEETVYKQSGGRFSFASAWRTLPPPRFLAGRYGSPAVWNGDGMLLWDGVPLSQTGGLFYPNSDPSARVAAIHDHHLQAPLCALSPQGYPLYVCDSGAALYGVGAGEAHAPNTIAGQAPDGTLGDEFIERIYLWNKAGGTITPGSTLSLYFVLHPSSTAFSANILTLQYSTNPFAQTPSWQDVPLSWTPPANAQAFTFSTELDLSQLPGGPYYELGFRAHFFRNEMPIDPDYGDYDDLVMIISGDPDTRVPAYAIGSTEPLVLDGGISTTGTNLFTSTPWEDALDSIYADDYVWWLNYHPETVETCGAMVTPPSRLGASLALGQGDLAGLGMNGPGRYRARLQVTDELGLSSCWDFDLDLFDTQEPSVELIIPDGGETWPFSPSDTDRRQDLIAWGSFDEFGPRRTRLSYTTNCTDPTCSAATWTCIADSGLRSWAPNLPRAIPDGNAGSSNLEMLDSYPIYDVNVTVTVRHPYVGDIYLLLIHPSSGRQAQLGRYRGGKAADYLNTTFDDEAPLAIASGTAPFSGTYRPEEDLAVFDGDTTGGIWTLAAYDATTDGLVGFFESWSITFVTSSSGDCSGGSNDANSNISGTDTLTPDSTNFLWDLPTKTEAASDGQEFPSAQCRVKVEIWDPSDNLGYDLSADNFYIVQPTTTSVDTLILWNSLRIRALYGDSAAASLLVRLDALAQNLKVNGKVLDLNDSPTLRDAYTAWDLEPLSVTRANALAQAIWTYLYAPSSGKISTTYSNTRAILLVGDDRQIPFYRMADGTMQGSYSESHYSSEVAINPRTAVGAALAGDYFLTDNFYSEDAPEDSGLDSPHDQLYQNDYAIGRLVETPAQMEAVINTFLAQDGEVDLHSRTSLVTGLDFVYDGAAAVKDGMESSIGAGAADCLMDDPLRNNTSIDINQCILPESDPLSERPYTPMEMGMQLLKGTSDPNDPPASPLNAILTHANHYAFAASQSDGSSVNYCTKNTPGSEYEAGCSWGTSMEDDPNDVQSAVVYTSGCHSGLSVPPAGVPPDLPLTIPYGEASSTITISESDLIISDLNVRVTLQHPQDGALTIVLDTPFGTLPLSNLRGGAGANFILTTFDDQASIAIADGAAPFTGAYRPETPLSMLPAASPDGTWGLRVGDTAGGGRGAIVDWCLIFNDSVAYPSSPFAVDLPEEMAKKRAVAFVGNTGYGWAIQNGLGLTETLVVNLTEELAEAGSISVGEALANAKRNYFLEDKRYDVFDEKVLHQMTLFGIPNYSIINTSGARAAGQDEKLPSPGGPDHACADDICLDKEVRTSALNADLPSGMTEILQNIRFADFGVYALKEVCNEVDLLPGCGPTDLPYFGKYYTLNGLASGETGDAIQPKFIYETYLSGTHHHGILFTGGSLTAPETGFKVLGAVPRSTPTDPNPDSGPLPSIGGFVPALRDSVSPGGSLSQRASDEKEYVNMVVHTGYCTAYDTIAKTCTEHRYRDMQYATYYHLSSADYMAPALQASEETTVAPSAACSTFDCSVADGGSTSAYIPVTDDLAVTDINVTVNITHGNPADLRLTLIAPDATAVVLSDQHGGSADDYGGLTSPVRNTVFDDDATVPVASGVGPFRGSYRPDNPVNGTFQGKSSLGSWTLQVDDLNANGETGTINAWSLTFNERYHTVTGLDATFRVMATDASGLYRVLVTYKDEGLQSPAWKSLDLTENASAGYWEGQLQVWGTTAYFIQAVDQAGNVGQVKEAGQDHGSGIEGVKYGSTWEYAKSFSIPILDTDGDALPDVYEDQHACLDKGTPDAGGDPDLDLLTNLEEYYAGTDPCLGDSDKGGDNDGSEKHNGRNPLSSSDDRPLTVTVVKGGGDLATLEWPDGVQSSPACPLKPNERFNDVIDGYYFVYRSLDDPFFTDAELLTTDGLDEAIRCHEDATAIAPGQIGYYKLFNYPLVPPQPGAVMPNFGSTAGGKPVSLVGLDFQAGARVFFGGVPATGVALVDGHLDCLTPPHAAGWVTVMVVNSDGAQGSLPSGFQYQ